MSNAMIEGYNDPAFLGEDGRLRELLARRIVHSWNFIDKDPRRWDDLSPDKQKNAFEAADLLLDGIIDPEIRMATGH